VYPAIGVECGGVGPSFNRAFSAEIFNLCFIGEKMYRSVCAMQIRTAIATCSLLFLPILINASFGGHALAEDSQDIPGTPDPSISSSISVIADPARLRSSLDDRGITFGLSYIGEVLSNRKGGLERGTIHDGRFELYIDADLEKSLGWRGLTFHAHGYDIHGEGITATKVGNLNALSGIEATATTRLLEIWFEQKLFNDALAIRLGQMAVDMEFILADSASQFISASFGWPTITASNLPNGGSAYPLSAPGVRVEWKASDQLVLRVGVFNDDPAGPCDTDPQVCNPHGLEFRIKDEPYVIGEVEYRYNKNGAHPGMIKLGGWGDFGTFDDQRFDENGLSLASPASTGSAKRYDEDYGFYAIIDQRLYASTSGNKTVSAFARVMGAPSDRNLVDFYLDGGLVFAGFVPGRPKDSFGIAAAVAGISGRSSDLDRDAVAFGTTTPIRNDEVLMEINYIAEIIPGWTLQPDFQYAWSPGGNVPDETGTKPLGDALIIGARTSISY
jgi:porin